LQKEAGNMPAEIFDIDKFVQVAERAEYCAIKRLKKTVKLKLKTPKKLYTLKIDPNKADEVLKKIRCEVREV
jgi:ferritin-like protein